MALQMVSDRSRSKVRVLALLHYSGLNGVSENKAQ